jgi:hypothetical protein
MYFYALGALAAATAWLAISDGKYTITRSIMISTPASEVFSKIVDFRQFEHWSPWEHLDPAMQKEFGGEPGEVGSSYHWSGNQKVGEGTMTVLDVQARQGLDIRLEFFRPFEDRCQTRWEVSPEGDGCIVTWTMKGENRSLPRKLFGLLFRMKKMLASDFDRGLSRLKKYCEGTESR